MTDDQPPALGTGLDRLFAPRSIAIIGASDRAGSFGQRAQANLEDFAGDLYLINPRRDEIGGRPCFASVADLPATPDCVLIATPRETVEPLVDSCAAAGVGGCVIFASGFSEVGTDDRIALQQRISARARAAGMRIAGPNTIGYVNFARRAGVTFMADLYLEKGYEAPPEQRTIGLVSQSGALGLALTQGMLMGQFFSHALTCGNQSDVDVADCIAFLAHDPTCKVIACNFEGHANPRRMAEAARIASDAGKPLVIAKMAQGESGTAAAASHTGSLAGSHEAYVSMFEHAGAVLVDEYEALLETAAFFAKSRPNPGEGAAIVATSGGAAIMAADAAEKHGVPLPQPSPALRERLEARIPEFGSAANPCDVTAQVLADMASLTDCATGFLEDDSYGTFVIPHLFAYPFSTARIPVLDALAERYHKVICTVWLSAWLEGPGARELIEAPHTVLFRSMDRCFFAFAAWRRWLARGALTADAPRSAPASARERAAALLDGHTGTLTEREAKPILAAYGISVVQEHSAPTAEDAARMAEQAGYPVVLKVDAPGLAHKTEAGGVALNLRSADEVRETAKRMLAIDGAQGVLVQAMAPKGIEIVIGGRHDPVFGPLVLVGLGGTLVEVLRDTVTAPAPVTPAQASRMLDRLHHGAILDGVRDLPAVDRDALALAVARVSELLADFPRIAELDINPLICRGADLIAVDGLIVLSQT